MFMLIEYAPTVQLSVLVNSLKAVTSRRLRNEFLDLRGAYSKPVLWSRLLLCGLLRRSTVGGDQAIHSKPAGLTPRRNSSHLRRRESPSHLRWRHCAPLPVLTLTLAMLLWSSSFIALKHVLEIWSSVRCFSCGWGGVLLLAALLPPACRVTYQKGIGAGWPWDGGF